MSAATSYSIYLQRCLNVKGNLKNVKVQKHGFPDMLSSSEQKARCNRFKMYLSLVHVGMPFLGKLSISFTQISLTITFKKSMIKFKSKHKNNNIMTSYTVQ